jgi:3'-5' exoribonuclease
LLGHITIGIELVNKLWRKLAEKQGDAWALLQPASEDVRLHLLHLVASHHGELQFGSPVVPKTPEAWALHYIDNMDAKLEMMFAAYPGAKPLGAPGSRVFDRVRPLPGNLVAPLARYAPPAEEGSFRLDGSGSNGNGHKPPASHNGKAPSRDEGLNLPCDHDGEEPGELLLPQMGR